MLENLKDYNIILSSQSPRRQELLKNIGLNFKIKVKENVDESYPSNLPAREIAEYLAVKKLKAYKEHFTQNTLIITADTVVIKRDDVLGKPNSKEEAVAMLENLSDTYHTVTTGVCIATLEKQASFTSATKVFFSKLSEKEIEHYIETYRPFDKAGSYGIQEWIGYIGIEKIEGCFYNVMGLPLHQLYKTLKEF